jgi:hypothetical protein
MSSTSDFLEKPICGILVVLDIGSHQALFIRLGSDGSIHRLGTGVHDPAERDRFIGRTSPEIFERVRSKVTPQLLEWCGQLRAHPAPRGRTCVLVIGFKRADGRELMMGWKYGSHSQPPPREVREFVTASVEATLPWYEEQKERLRRRAESEGWQVIPLPQA